MVAPVLLALWLAAGPALLTADAPRAHPGWLLPDLSTARAAEVWLVAPPPTPAKAGAVATSVGVVLMAGGLSMSRGATPGARLAGAPLLLGGLLVLVGLPMVVDGALRGDAAPPPCAARAPPPGPSALEGPATLAAFTRAPPAEGFTVLAFP